MSVSGRRRFVLAAALGLAGLARAEDDAAVRALATMVPAARGMALADLARETVARVASGRPVPETHGGDVVACGLFVTLVGPGGMRGCYGDLNARDGSLEGALLVAARGAAAGDLRFRPVKPSEVAGLTVIVSLTLPAEPVRDPGAVDPDRYGLLVSAGSREAVLLPGEARTASHGLREALRKAGIEPGEPVTSFRFRTLTYMSRGVR